jgi:MoaA/NifB/PqqE/SkfB family radical SAM enzyme
MAHAPSPAHDGLRSGFVSLEITSECNLACRYCDPGAPGARSHEALGHEDFLRLILEADDAGFATIQLAGGEPLLYRRVHELLWRAQRGRFERVELLSNLTILRGDVLQLIEPQRTIVATTVNSDDPRTHDSIVGKPGSFARAIAGIRELIARSIRVRADFIETQENVGHFERTRALLNAIGVPDVGFERLRSFGDLCESCNGDALYVASDGSVAPCSMSRTRPLGNVAVSSLGEIERSRALRRETGGTKRGPGCAPRGRAVCYPGRLCALPSALGRAGAPSARGHAAAGA